MLALHSALAKVMAVVRTTMMAVLLLAVVEAATRPVMVVDVARAPVSVPLCGGGHVVLR